MAVGEGETAGDAVNAGAEVASGEAVGAAGDAEIFPVAGEGETAAGAVGAGDAWVLASSRRSALWLVLLCA